jgi:hypothetical protein
LENFGTPLAMTNLEQVNYLLDQENEHKNNCFGGSFFWFYKKFGVLGFIIFGFLIFKEKLVPFFWTNHKKISVNRFFWGFTKISSIFLDKSQN